MLETLPNCTEPDILAPRQSSQAVSCAFHNAHVTDLQKFFAEEGALGHSSAQTCQTHLQVAVVRPEHRRL